MNLKTIIEFLVSDVLTATAISMVTMWISNKHADENERQADRNIQELKSHIDLRLQVIESHIENFINAK